jgi:heme/copper-type cytochrome/quinol oxidase subunit 2
VSRRALLVTGCLLLTGCAGTAPAAESTSTPPDQRIEVEVAGGQVSGDTGRVPVPEGTHVTLVVTSDVADEVHVHGYDVESGLEPGTPAELSFDATIPGVFEVELHESGTVLLTLQVA